MCQSLYCTININGAFCSDSVQSLRLLPANCSSNWDCMSTTDRYVGGFYLGTCQCGYNPLGRAYCSLFPGDYPYRNYIAVISSWLNSPNITNCNSLRGLNQNCVEKYFSYSNELFYYYYYVNLYPLLQNNPQCIKDTITYQYWDEEEVMANRTVISAAEGIAVAFSLAIYVW